MPSKTSTTNTATTATANAADKVAKKTNPDPDLSFAFTETASTDKWMPLEVSGEIPSWITGHLYRVGPGSFIQPKVKGAGLDHNTGSNSNQWRLQHWFDGLSMLHEFHITGDNGQVFYRSKDMSKGFQEKAIEQGGFFSFGPKDPCQSMFSKVSTVFKQARVMLTSNLDLSQVACNENVNIFRGLSSSKTSSSDDELLYIVTDATFLQSLDPISLEPKRMLTYANVSDKINGILSCAHGLLDPRTNEFFNYTISFGVSGGTTLTAFALDKGTGNVRLLAPVQTAQASYVHSFSLTTDYVIIVAYPALYDPMRLVYHQTFTDSVIFDSEKETRLFLIPRDGIRPAIVHQGLPSFFSFHHVNAFQEQLPVVGTDGGLLATTTTTIHVDLSTYDDMKICEQLLIQNILNPEQSGLDDPVLHRISIVLDPAGSSIQSVSMAPLLDRTSGTALSLELPRIAYEGLDRPTSIVYGIGHHEHRFSSALRKINVPDRSQKSWTARNMYPGEPIFVPRPDAVCEDDGAILSVVLDAETQSSFLLILDAKEWKEIARATLGHGKFIIPGFHGAFYQ